MSRMRLNFPPSPRHSFSPVGVCAPAQRQLIRSATEGTLFRGAIKSAHGTKIASLPLAVAKGRTADEAAPRALSPEPESRIGPAAREGPVGKRKV